MSPSCNTNTKKKTPRQGGRGAEFGVRYGVAAELDNRNAQKPLLFPAKRAPWKCPPTPDRGDEDQRTSEVLITA